VVSQLILGDAGLGDRARRIPKSQTHQSTAKRKGSSSKGWRCPSQQKVDTLYYLFDKDDGKLYFACFQLWIKSKYCFAFGPKIKIKEKRDQPHL
jgi:hypothetical protein